MNFLTYWHCFLFSSPLFSSPLRFNCLSQHFLVFDLQLSLLLYWSTATAEPIADPLNGSTDQLSFRSAFLASPVITSYNAIITSLKGRFPCRWVSGSGFSKRCLETILVVMESWIKLILTEVKTILMLLSCPAPFLLVRNNIFQQIWYF